MEYFICEYFLTEGNNLSLFWDMYVDNELFIFLTFYCGKLENLYISRQNNIVYHPVASFKNVQFLKK